jgi:ribosome-associated protein
VLAATHVPKPRKATRPTRGSQQRRLSEKTHRGQIKSLRGKPDDH